MGTPTVGFAGYGMRTPLRTASRQVPKIVVMDPVEVFCRVKPAAKRQDEICVRAIDEYSVQLNLPSHRLPTDAPTAKETISRFTYVFDEAATQKMVFDRVAYELVNGVLRGKNGLLFTYGITGSGKTYTMTGVPEDIGILPRCLDVIFNSIAGCQANRRVFVPDKMNGFDVQGESEAASAKHCEPALRTPAAVDSDPEWELCPRSIEQTRVPGIDEDNAYSVFVSYIEIYNQYVYDLLESSSDRSKPPVSKQLREDVNRNMYVSNAVEVEVKSTEEAFAVFAKGQLVRRVAHTLLNTESSRSHSVFNIRIVQAPLDETGCEVLQDKSRICVSQLALVDLAGSERSRRTNHTGERIRETGCINHSLMVLRQCIEQLRYNQKTGADRLVPYRDSRLTHLFKNYFDGDGKVRMVVCLNPSAADYDENMHVMQFAELTQEVEVPRSVPAGYEVDGLTPGRRRAAALMKELSESFELHSVVNASVRLFSPLPSLPVAFSTPDELETVLLQIKSHWEVIGEQTLDINEKLRRDEQKFKESIAKLATCNGSMVRQLEESKRQVQRLEVDKRRLECELADTKSQLTSMKYRVGRFERDARFLINQEEMMKRREREMAARERLKDEKLLAVKEIVDRNQPVRTWQYRGTAEKYASMRTAFTTNSMTSSSSAASGRRPPSPPPKPRVRLVSRRRSKSADSVTRHFQPHHDKPMAQRLNDAHPGIAYIDEQDDKPNVGVVKGRKRSSGGDDDDDDDSSDSGKKSKPTAK